MAGENETPFSYYAGVNLYAIVREPGGDVLNEGTDTFEAYSTGNRDQYGLTPTEQDTGDTNSNYVFTNTAAMSAATTYTIRIYEMAGLEPAEGDEEVGVGVIGPELGSASFDGKTGVELLRIIGAAAAGKVSGAGTGTEVFKGVDGNTTRATVTVDQDGNRSGVTYG